MISIVVAPVSIMADSIEVHHNAPPSANEIDADLVCLIDSAETSIDMAAFDIDRQSIVTALINAKGNGVTVRVVTEADNYDSESPSYQYFQQLSTAGIAIVKDTAGGSGTGSGLCHDKFVVIDENVTWTGSYNFTNSSTTANSNDAVLINSQDISEAFTAEFVQMFEAEKFGIYKSDCCNPHYATVDGSTVEFYFAPINNVKQALRAAINDAHYSIYFLIFTFTDNEIAGDLITKSGAGVDVKGVFDSDSRSVSGGEYVNLRTAGLPVRIDTLTGKLHHKLMIIDHGHANSDPVAITGSFNWTANAETQNDENLVIFHNSSIVDQYFVIFDDIFSNHAEDEGATASDSIIINEIMNTGKMDSAPEPTPRINWGQSDENGGTPGEPNSVDLIPPVIVHTPCLQTLVGRALHIGCRIYDPNDPDMYSAKAPLLHYRITGTQTYSTTGLSALLDEYRGTIPAEAVTEAGVDYYLTAMDYANNLGASPPLNFKNHPHQVAVIGDPCTPPCATVRFSEIMYDPPQTLNGKEDNGYEWVEITNRGDYSVDLSGWTFTDLEGTYILPSAAAIQPGEYQILCRNENIFTNLPENTVVYVYGADMVGSIILPNIHGGVTDELILKNADGIVMEQVNYSADWGASNTAGPNNHTLEKMDFEQPDDVKNTWLPSMIEGGTPGAAAGPHFIFHSYEKDNEITEESGIWLDPTQINPPNESCTISYRLDRECIVTIKFYNPPPECNDQDCAFSPAYLVKTEARGTQQASPSVTIPDKLEHHRWNWDGRDSQGNPVAGIVRVVVEAQETASQPRTCLCQSNDVMMSVMHHGFNPDVFNVYAHEPTMYEFHLVKPAFATLVIIQDHNPIRVLCNAMAFPRTPEGQSGLFVPWDGRCDNGRFVKPDKAFSIDFDTGDIYGNVVICRTPLKLFGVRTSPRSYFDPSLSSEDPHSKERIDFSINVQADVDLVIRDSTGEEVISNSWQQLEAGSAYYVWDGEGAADGMYTYELKATANGEEIRHIGDIALYTFFDEQQSNKKNNLDQGRVN